jgi:hypothetical protein
VFDHESLTDGALDKGLFQRYVMCSSSPSHKAKGELFLNIPCWVTDLFRVMLWLIWGIALPFNAFRLGFAYRLCRRWYKVT